MKAGGWPSGADGWMAGRERAHALASAPCGCPRWRSSHPTALSRMPRLPCAHTHTHRVPFSSFLSGCSVSHPCGAGHLPASPQLWSGGRTRLLRCCSSPCCTGALPRLTRGRVPGPPRRGAPTSPCVLTAHWGMSVCPLAPIPPAGARGGVPGLPGGGRMRPCPPTCCAGLATRRRWGAEECVCFRAKRRAAGGGGSSGNVHGTPLR